MLTQNKCAVQYYSYEDFNIMQAILKDDKLCEYKFLPQTNWIEYTIDRSQCISLKDLLYSIESNLVNIHLGQILVLVKSLIQKVMDMETIQHEYINIERIWLKFKSTSQKPSILYQNFDYTIHFVGYQCPFYEREFNNRISARQSILGISTKILENCFKLIKYSKGEEIINKLITPILNQIQGGDLFNVFIFIMNILEDNYYEEQNQTIICDEKKDSKNIKQLARSIPTYLQLIEQCGYNQKMLVTEELIFRNILNLTKVERQKFMNMELFNNQKQLLLNQINDIQQEIRRLLNQFIDGDLNEILKKIQKIQKVKIEIVQLGQEIIQGILQSPEINYFFNSYWTYYSNGNVKNIIIPKLLSIYTKFVDKKVIQPHKLFMLKVINDII